MADQAEDFLPFALQPRLVGLAVLRMQFDLEDLFLLGGQVGGYLFLGAAPDQWLDPPLELGEPLGDRRLLRRRAVLAAD